MFKILAGLFLVGTLSYQAGAAQPAHQLTSAAEPASAQLAKDQIQLATYVVEINSSDHLFGALHWPEALDQASETFALNGSVSAAPDAMFPKHAFFREGLILAEPVAKAKIRALIQRGKLKPTDPPVAYSENGRRVLIRSLGQNQTIFLEEATPYTFDTGLTLDIVPRMLEGGIIDLAINPAFSTQIGNRGDNNTPTIAIGSATAQVKLRSGEAAVIGGLTREVPNYSNNNVPGLRKIPLLDYLFEGGASATQRTNMVIIVWARIADKTVQHGPGDVALLFP
jgi:Bacterial type II and III secretion system protein